MFRYFMILAGLAPVALAQSPASPPSAAPSSSPFVTPPPSASPSAAPVPRPVSATPPAKHEISAGAAAMLAQAAPAYNPPKAEPAKTNAGDTDDSSDDNEQPRNHIIRLPKYVVHDQAPPIFREKDLYDKDGLQRLALMRYKGLGIMPFSSMNGAIADEMYREDDRLKMMADFNSTADAIQAGGDKAEADFIRSATQSTYAQSVGWGDPTPTNPSARGMPGSP